ncbi:DNA polymerase III subunit [Candidatus Peregrinibacteria bacterium]|nr:DNA polymerase III subunit [Candidatus Peregrinibacteria bacterium]
MKYNWSIIGHEKQLAQIENDISSGNLAHAYLLAGPNSVGKNTVARKLAGILQCENDFCHSCNACLQVEKGCHVDTVVFEDNGESIKIEEVRRIMERLNMTRQAQYKILLIQSLERMRTEAANSFLKMLEEPPERTIFIMTTDNVRVILPTILSRVRVVKFNSVSNSYLRDKLKQLYPKSEAETIETVSLLSLGKTGKAVHLMEHPDSLANYLKTYHDIQNFLAYRSVSERFSYIEEMLEDPLRIETFMNILTHVLRSKMLEPGRQGGGKIYAKALSKIDEAAMLLRQNINVRLVLENLMLQI